MIKAVEAFDNFAPLRNGLRRVAADRNDWAGIPMPLQGQRLIIHPKFPDADNLSDMGQEPAPPDDGLATYRNSFWSRRHRADVVIWEEGGKIVHAVMPNFHHLGHDLRTLGASVVWGIEQEGKAVQLLASMVRHHQFKQYLLTGMFLETSPRSGITYLFRKLKPTVALISRESEERSMRYEIGASEGRQQNDVRILCTLCMHPIAYYEKSWAGAMCPTDDVVAHLALMRGDEAMYWRRSNQTAPDRPEAGL